MIRTQRFMIVALIFTTCSQMTLAGWPFSSSEEDCDNESPRWGTKAYYESRASDPVGSRQKYKYGKLWPPVPRPVGKKQTLVHKFHAAHYWPLPYSCQDEASVRAYMDIQTQNGWQTATTFYDYHFDPATQGLNSAGYQHLNWLVKHVPDMHREAFVASSVDPQINSIRLANLEQEITRFTGGQTIPVYPRQADAPYRPAAEVDRVFRMSLESMPEPKIRPLGTSEGESGGGN